MKRLTFILTLLISGLAVINGQQPISPAIQQQVQSELEKRGVTEAELRERLLTKGVDPDRITPEQLPRFQQIIEETIAELEAEKKAAMPDTPNAAETEAAAGDLPSPPPTENPPANAEPPAASPSNLPDQDPAKDEIYGHHLFENQTIAEAAFEAEAGALTIAAASMLTEQVRGMSVSAALDFAAVARASLEADADQPLAEGLGELAALAGVRAYPSRRRAVTLPIAALQAALAGKPQATTETG